MSTVDAAGADLMGASSSDPAHPTSRSDLPPATQPAAATGRHRILVVEDNRADVFLLREAMDAAQVEADLQILTDGEMALGFIQQADVDENAACPNLVILDLNLPKITGGEVLEFLRGSEKCRHTPVLIVTSSDSEQDKSRTARLGANRYFRKPSGYDAFMKIGDLIREMLIGNVPDGGLPVL